MSERQTHYLSKEGKEVPIPDNMREQMEIQRLRHLTNQANPQQPETKQPNPVPRSPFARNIS